MYKNLLEFNQFASESPHHSTVFRFWCCAAGGSSFARLIFTILPSLAECVPKGAQKLFPPAPQHQKQKTMLWFEREHLFRPSENHFFAPRSTKKRDKNHSRGIAKRGQPPKTNERKRGSDIENKA